MEFNDKQIAIIKVAETLISEKGFEAASIREISKRAGINLAMVSYYFGSKEKLLEAIFILKAKQFELQRASVIENSTWSFFEKVMKLSENYLDRVFGNYSFHSIMLKEISFLDSTVAFEQIKKMKDNNFALLTNLIEEGIKNNEISPNVTTDALISVVNGTVANYTLNEKYYRIRWGLDANRSFEEQAQSRIKKQILQTLKIILTHHENI